MDPNSSDGTEDEIGEALRDLAAASVVSTPRMRFGSSFDGAGKNDGKGCLSWCKIVRGGRRPEIVLRVNEAASRFRGRCLPAGRTLDEIEALERSCAVVEGGSDLLVPKRFVQCHLLVRLLGFDENMNLCFQPTKPWKSDDETLHADDDAVFSTRVYNELATAASSTRIYEKDESLSNLTT